MTEDPSMVLLKIQVTHTMELADAMAGVLMSFGYFIRDEENANPALEKMPEAVKAAFANLESVISGDDR